MANLTKLRGVTLSDNPGELSLTDRETISARLSDKMWRLTSGVLYKVVSKHGKVVPFQPNAVQLDFLKNRHTKNIVLKARQHGMTTLLAIDEFDDACFSKNKSIGIIAQDLDSANDIFSNKVRFLYDNLPGWLKEMFPFRTERQGEMRFADNGSTMSVDTSFRSSTLQKLHITELGKVCAKFPEKAREIQTGALNTLAPTCEVTIESTAEGSSGLFFDMCQEAIANMQLGKKLTDMDYKFHFYPWFLDKTYSLDDTFPISSEVKEYFGKIKGDAWITKKYPGLEFTDSQMRWYQKKWKEQGDDMGREFPSYPDEAFQLAVKGAYYERELGAARQQRRICNVAYDTRIPVQTAWDLGGAGGGDETAIWFFQQFGKEVRLIDYWEGSGYSMVDIVRVAIREKPYHYDTHFLPHDAEVHEYTTGKTRISTLREMGLRCLSLPKLSIADGINEVRNIFPRCYFDEAKTGLGLKHLQSYSRAWDPKNGRFKDYPKHDVHSNCFIAGTLVSTSFGDKKIEELEIGDLVDTPVGQLPVTATLSSESNDLYEVEFSNGKKLVCTGNHPFPTNFGLTNCDALRYYHTVFVNDVCEKSTRSKNSMEEGSIYGQTGTTLPISTGTGIALCTGSYGSRFMEKLAKGWKSITSTKTNQTTKSQTSKGYREANTHAYTLGEEKAGGGSVGSVSLGKLLRSGIVPTMGENGTVIMRSCLGSDGSLPKGSVVLAERNSSDLGTGFAEDTAKQSSVSFPVLMTKHVFALLAGVLSLVTGTLKNQPVARVVRIKKLEGRKDRVYDITVPVAHVFYANGVLVGNCADAFRYLAISCRSSSYEEQGGTIYQDFGLDSLLR
jgi:hypothetical protein